MHMHYIHNASCMQLKQTKLILLLLLLFSCRVIDLGVMVPCDQILREAVTQKAGNCKDQTDRNVMESFISQRFI